MDTKLFVRNQPGGFFAVTDREFNPSGSVFWVHAGTGTDGAGYGRNPDAPVATLDYAVGLCTASKGDVIMLMPGHAENIASATGCVLDVAGIKVVGLGWAGMRPTLTLTASAASTISITAANIWVKNVLIVSNFLNIVSAMTVAATATGLTLEDVEMADTSVILAALIQISVGAAAHDLTLINFKHRVIAVAGLTAAATNVIKCAGAIDRLTIRGMDIQCFTTAAAVACAVGTYIDVLVTDVRLIQYETGAGLGMAFDNASRGFVDNFVGVNLSNTVKPLSGTGLSIGPNVRYSNALGAYAGLYAYTVDS